MASMKKRFDALYFEYINADPHPEGLWEELENTGRIDFYRFCRSYHATHDAAEDMVRDAFNFLFDQSPGVVRTSACVFVYNKLRNLLAKHGKRLDKEREFKDALPEDDLSNPWTQGVFEDVIRQTVEESWEHDMSVLGNALESAENAMFTDTVGKHRHKMMTSEVLRAMLREYIDVLMEESEHSATKTEWKRSRLPLFLTKDGRALTPDEFQAYWDRRLRPVLLEKLRKHFAGRDEDSPPFGVFLP